MQILHFITDLILIGAVFYLIFLEKSKAKNDK